MFRTLAAGLVGLAMGLGAVAADAATIAGFGRTTNDGVFTLSAGQAAFLGTPDADRIGFFRVRSGGNPNVSWDAGDDFTADAFFATVTSNASAILGVFNGF